MKRHVARIAASLAALQLSALNARAQLFGEETVEEGVGEF